MASQVLSGTSNVSYTNNTGQNVRIVINYMQGGTTIPTGNLPTQSTSGSTGITLSWSATNGGTVSVNAPGALAIGRNLAFSHAGGEDLFKDNSGLTLSSNNMVTYESGAAQRSNNGLPTEIIIASGQTFSAVCSAYNIVCIPEGG